jgi:hypothetical protein
MKKSQVPPEAGLRGLREVSDTVGAARAGFRRRVEAKRMATDLMELSILASVRRLIFEI